MSFQRWLYLILAVAFVLIALLFVRMHGAAAQGIAGRAKGDVEAGRLSAQAWCTECHSVQRETAEDRQVRAGLHGDRQPALGAVAARHPAQQARADAGLRIQAGRGRRSGRLLVARLKRGRAASGSELRRFLIELRRGRVARPHDGCNDAALRGATSRARPGPARHRAPAPWPEPSSLEEADLLVHRLRLLLQRPGGRGILLDQRRVLLGDLVHLGQRLVDLIDAVGLFGAGAGDVGDDVGDGVDRLQRSRGAARRRG